MKPSTLFVSAAASACASTAEGFAFVQPRHAGSSTSLQMGLFDGVKEAFGSGEEGMGALDGDRETPIDRWMGWNTKSSEPQQSVGSKQPANFVDSMEPSNYISVALPKPMGIVFEENDESMGGIFVFELSEDSIAAKEGTIKPGDQLVAVGGKKVSGLKFDEALGTIIDSTEEMTQLTVFRGPAKYLYGPTGASQEWLDEFIATSGAVKTA